ncbi:MAG: hypothetical protein NT033_10780 [Candidatus Omnitrophica bacterium]|nr:hypothetical protein [Candidatus Omnitrophota bacterium]
MIQINLLPEELKARNNVTLTPRDYAVYVSAGLLAALLVLHILLGFVFVVREFRLGIETVAWQQQEPLLKKVDNFKQEYGYLFQDDYLTGQSGPAISWSEKLSCLSSDLPGGIWLKELIFNDKNFQLRGSIISLQKNEVGLMNSYLDALKKDSNFYRDFVSLEPGPLKRRVIVTYDVVDFSLQGILRTR